MKIMVYTLLSLVLTALLLACAPEPEPTMERATVNAEHSSVRMRDSGTSRTLKVLEPGEQVEILERSGRWYRIRTGDIEGWMEVTTLLTDSIRSQMEQNVESARGQIPENTGVLTQDANLRITPGRDTSVQRRVPARTHVEVLQRVTLPREDLPGRVDSWLKVRTKPDEVGWLLSSFVDFDVPDPIARYTEDYVYSAVKTLSKVEDPALGTIEWYIVGERRPGANPNLDFEGIRVFTWNLARQRYETAFRLRGIQGVYPLEVGQDGGKPTFRIHELSSDGTTKQVREFVMNGVIVREVKATG